MSWDCQCRSSKPETCQLFTQPATYLLNLPTYFPTCKLFSQTCQLFPQPANFLPKPANFFPNLPTFSLNLPTFSQTCQLLSQDLGGDPPPPDGHLSQPWIIHSISSKVRVHLPVCLIGLYHIHRWKTNSSRTWWMFSPKLF